MRVSLASCAAPLRRLGPLLLAVVLAASAAMPANGTSAPAKSCCGMADAGAPAHDCCCPAPAPCRTIPPVPNGAATPARASAVREIARPVEIRRTADTVAFARLVAATPIFPSIAAQLAARYAPPPAPDLPHLQTFRI